MSDETKELIAKDMDLTLDEVEELIARAVQSSDELERRM
jgi:hypothetical protein